MINVKIKITVIITVTLILTGLTTGLNIGTYTPEESKETDELDATFKIKIMNLGDETLNVNLSSTEPDATSIYYFDGQENVDDYELEPSTTTENPKDYDLSEEEEWFLYNERYVKVEEIPITITIDNEERTTDNFEFTTTLEAQRTQTFETGEDDEVEPRQQIIQTRNFDFRLSTNADRESTYTIQESTPEENDGYNLDTSGSLSFPSLEGNFLQEDEQDNSQEISVANNDESPEEDESTRTERMNEEESNTDETRDQNSESSLMTAKFLQNTSTDISTIILILTSIMSVFYLIKVV